MPRAIIIGISLTTICYLLVNVAYIAVLGKALILKSEAVAVVSCKGQVKILNATCRSALYNKWISIDSHFVHCSFVSCLATEYLRVCLSVVMYIHVFIVYCFMARIVLIVRIVVC